MKKLLSKTILGLNVLICLGAAGLQSQAILASDTLTTPKSTHNKLRSLNLTLNQKLFDLREHPKTYDKVAPKCKYQWFKYVENINFLKNQQLEIYVTPKFQTLDEGTRKDIVYHAQMFSFQIAEKSQHLSATQYREGLAAIIFCEGNYLGRSQYLHNDEMIWKK